MKFKPSVIKAVAEHYNKEWNGNTRQITERYNLRSPSEAKSFIKECKEFAQSMGAVFVHDGKLNYFVCVDGNSDDSERLVKRTLKNHYSQGKSTRRDMATMHREGKIGDDINEAFSRYQQAGKGIINSLSD